MNYRVPSSYSPYAAVPLDYCGFPLHSEAFLFLGLCSADLKLFSQYQLIAHNRQSFSLMSWSLMMSLDSLFSFFRRILE
jgi:hypothetical protein